MNTPKTYRFLVRGTTQKTTTARPDLIGMIDGAILEFPMAMAKGEPPRYVVTNEYLFDALMEQIQEALEA